jgi:rubrerythrin
LAIIAASAKSLDTGQGVYDAMAAKMEDEPARQLFHELSQIKMKHQGRIL